VHPPVWLSLTQLDGQHVSTRAPKLGHVDSVETTRMEPKKLSTDAHLLLIGRIDAQVHKPMTSDGMIAFVCYGICFVGENPLGVAWTATSCHSIGR
jgi:hypothetical protein